MPAGASRTRFRSLVVLAALAALFSARPACGETSASSVEPLSRAAAGELAPPPAPEGFRLAEQRTYTARNLFEYINGQAEQYLGYGFQSLLAAEYESKEGQLTLTLDLYTLATPLEAYGLYLAQGAGLADTAGLQSPSGLDPYGGTLVKGRHLVQVRASASGPEVTPGLKSLLAAAAQRLPPAPTPPELNYLPPQGQDPQSLRYVKDGLFRLPPLPRGVAARYQVQGQRAELGLAWFDSPAAAARALKRAAAALAQPPQGSRVQVPNLPPGFEAFRHKPPGQLLLARHGRFVLVAAGLQDFQTGLDLIQALAARLP